MNPPTRWAAPAGREGNEWRVTCNGRNYCHEEAQEVAKRIPEGIKPKDQ